MNKPFILSVGVLPWVTRTAIRQFTKRVLRRGIRMRLPTGTSFMIPRNSLAGSTVYITQADVDYGSEALLARLASKRTGFLDVGANIGYYSAYMAPGFSFVYAFEPDARAFEHLVRLPSSLPNVRPFSFAISDKDGRGTLVRGASSDVSAMTTDAHAGTPVQTRTLDALLPDYPAPVSAIKIDTEGHELAVLAGADSLIARDRPAILLETPVTPPIIEWAARRRYFVGAACIPGNGSGPSFRWFTKPDSSHVKMVLLVPSEHAARLRIITAELYGRPEEYRRKLKRFQARTLELWNAEP